MTRSEFKNKLKNLIGYSLSCKDIEENPQLIGNRNFNVIETDCRKAFELLDESLSIDNFVLDAIIGDLENNVYNKLSINGLASEDITELVFTEDEYNIPDEAMDYISCDEVRAVCIDTTFDLADKIYERAHSEEVTSKMAM